MEPIVAYFSMEIGLESAIPTYAGGLGVLAGDTLRGAADLALPLVAVSLAHREGYFRQRLGESGAQEESPDSWSPEDHLEEMTSRVSVMIEGKPVRIRAWRYSIRGISGGVVPVYLLDTLLPENGPEHRSLTDVLYGGDDRYRLCQETVLGMGGVALLEALGHSAIQTYHMNEGHSALLALALLAREEGAASDSLASIRQRCVFTTHTPVPAGHDQFPVELVRQVLGAELSDLAVRFGCCTDGVLNLTHMALFFSHFVNGVGMRHGEISRGMFPDYPIASITNGVHAATWVAPPFQEVYDRHIPDWRQQNDNLRYAFGIPLDEIRAAHARCKAHLLDEVEKRSGVRLTQDHLTLGFARRATPYKRADMLVSQIDRLKRIDREAPLQIVYAGKAHPRDSSGKELIREIFEHARQLRGEIELVYLENYDMELGRLMCAGVDVWVNTPKKPEEASGTSGMKAALNGVPSLSVLDGWWLEGHVEGVTGWAIGDSEPFEAHPSREPEALYQKLDEITRVFYTDRDGFAVIMRYAIALNASFFNAERMVQQYALSAYPIGPGS